MLAKSAFLILGMVNQSPRGAYEINTMLDKMNIKYWLVMSNSAIYSTIRNLEKKNYIIGHTERNGNMPERTVYEITSTGQAILRSAIREAFCSVDFDTTVFSIASLYMWAVEAGELKGLMKKRQAILSEYKLEMSANIEQLRQYAPKYVVTDVTRMLYLIEAELKSITEMIIETDQ